MEFIDNLLIKVEKIFSLSPEATSKDAKNYSDFSGEKGNKEKNQKNYKKVVKQDMIIIKAKKFDETEKIVKKLKNGQSILLNLNKTEYQVARKILDFLSGAIYALDGSVEKVEKRVFLFAPKSINVSHKEDNILYNSLSKKEQESLYGE